MMKFRARRFAPNLRALPVLKPGRTPSREALENLKWVLNDIWIDLLVISILGFAAAIIWVAPHAFDRLFPIAFLNTSGDVVNPDYAYPYVPPPLSALNVALLCTLIPLAVMLVSQVWIQDFRLAVSTTLGFTYALVCGTLFQVILKKTIGGFRPHFLSVCEPHISSALSRNVPGDTARMPGRGFQNLMFTIDEVCHGDPRKISNAIESFPSGHSEIAWASMGFLTLYLATQLDVSCLLWQEVTAVVEDGDERDGDRSSKDAGLWRMPLVVSPLLLAMYISMGLVLSYNHHWWDVVAGGLIGGLMAVFAYSLASHRVSDGGRDQVGRSRQSKGIEDDLRDEEEARRNSVNGTVVLL